LVRGIEQPKWVAFSGLTLGFAVLCRSTDLFIAIPLAIYVLHVHRDQIYRFTLFALPCVIVLALYNWGYFGSVIRTGYGQAIFSENAWSTSFFEGLTGILLSPSRGLFVYSPIFLFSLIGIFSAQRHADSLLFRYLSVAVVLVIALYSKWIMWWGGWSFGPRLLADITPLLTLLLIPAYRQTRHRHLLKSGFYVLAGLSIAIHALGAFAPAGWSPDVGEPSHRLWSWSDGELMYSARGLLSKFTGRPYVQDIPRLRIIIDNEQYAPGDEVSVTLNLDAGKNPIAFDGYLLIFSQLVSARFVHAKGRSSDPAPFVASSSTAGRHDFMLSFRVPHDILPDTYSLQALLYKAGSPFSTIGNRENQLFVSQRVSFTVSP
jgi:hypothetical protein